MTLTDIQQKFVLHWGEMGARWGINRTVAQIHALLFLSAKPLHAEEIADTLGVARSNVSNSLRELRIIVDERKKREADPTLAMLRDAVAAAKNPDAADAYTRKRLADMLEFFEAMTRWTEQTRKLPTAAVVRMVKMGDKLGKLLGA
jgi:DNA-binding transcriptional regulator GbsR (MarR family)